MDLPETGTTQEGKQKVGLKSGWSLQDLVNSCIYSCSGDVDSSFSITGTVVLDNSSSTDAVVIDDDRETRHRFVRGWFDLDNS
jgi:hypothetical protein